jgi:hypothetical protein
MNIVLQQYGSSCYNVWEDVCISSTSDVLSGLSGLYRVHKYHKKIYDKERSCCSWSYKDLYLVKEVYGGFVEEIQKGVY